MSEKFLEGVPAKKPAEEEFAVKNAEAMREKSPEIETPENLEARNIEETYIDTAKKEGGFLSKIAESTKSKKVRNLILALQVSSILAAGASCKTMSANEMYAASVPTSGYIQSYKATQRQLIDERVWKERESERMQGRISALEDIKAGKYLTCSSPIPGLDFSIGREEAICFHVRNMRYKAYAESVSRGRYDALINHFKIFRGR